MADFEESDMLHIVRRFDPTPLLPKSGRFRGEMLSWVRCVLAGLERDGKRKTADWETDICSPKSAPRLGIWEVVAQSFVAPPGPGMDSMDSWCLSVAPSAMTRAS